ncbi:MAG: hypothetical protein HUK28_07340 [Methanobrevibacter sp.]|nr:hypothetical protein [Methanobrevibacter sp.]
MNSNKIILLLTLILFLYAISLSAVSAVDTQSFTELQKKVDNTNNGDILYLNGESYYQYLGGESIQINKNININGASKENSNIIATIEGNSKCSIFKINSGVSASFTNINFIKGQGENGGAIYAQNNCEITIDNCCFNNNKANNQGGAVYVCDNSHLSISNSIFISNQADKGGAVYCAKNTDLNIEESAFSLNIAKDKGGAIFMDKYCNLHVNNCTFNINAANQGGVIYSSDNCKGIVEKSNFYNNTYTSKVKDVALDCFAGGALFGAVIGIIKGACIEAIVEVVALAVTGYAALFALLIGVGLAIIGGLIAWFKYGSSEGSVLCASKSGSITFKDCHWDGKYIDGVFTKVGT